MFSPVEHSKVRSHHVPNVTATTLRPIMDEQLQKLRAPSATMAARVHATVSLITILSITAWANTFAATFTRTKLLLDQEARHHWRLLSCPSAASKAVPYPVRFYNETLGPECHLTQNARRKRSLGASASE